MRPRAELPWKTILVATGAVLGTIGVVAAVNRSASRAVQSSAPRRVALIGDSYAVGLGPELAKRVPNFRFEGHVGTSTAQWANHAAGCGTCGTWIADYRPAIALVSLGVNDGNAPNLANYQTIVRTLHGSGAKVIWIEPPAAVNTPAVRRVIASLGVPTVAATQTPLGADNLHPWSYTPWAIEVAQAVANA